eukprot:TRINITY_DN83_c0_g1_i1.p2 TRINITY_DN83_c0_g1~~TRINITY_DN83_c0_g1_i1.p2  ORF type:complete len:286 (+),score=88.61 TRINITY_DN83_c0_g1_i1:55-912(+)
MTNPPQEQKRNFPWKKSVAGAIAGIADVWSCHGLDRVKTHMQNNPGMNMSGAFKDIWKRNGIISLYEGVLPMTFEAIGKVGIRYFSFNWFTENYKRNFGGSPDSFSARMLGGAFAGTVESFSIVIPCELLKVRHMTQTGHVPFINVFRDVVRQEGIMGLYRGGSATYLRQATNHMIRFPVFYGISDYLKGHDKNKHISPAQNLAAGAFAGIVSAFCNNPLDTIKTRMQSHGQNKVGVFEAIRQIYASRGVVAFWAGVVPRAVRLAPGQAITWAVFEHVSKLLGPD